MSPTLRNGVRGTLALAVGVTLGVAVTTFVLGLRPQVPPSGLRASGAGAPAWAEVKWPFAPDPWSAGRAFKCTPANCGGEVTVYLRAKIGFCNCTTGVADDAELERVGDLALVGGTQTATGPGRPISVHWMKGRSRSYAIAGTSPQDKSVLMLAVNDRCDAIVATAIVGHEQPDKVESAVLDFLNGDVVLRWAQVTLGL
jgi:hypothetical protein